MIFSADPPPVAAGGGVYAAGGGVYVDGGAGAAWAAAGFTGCAAASPAVEETLASTGGLATAPLESAAAIGAPHDPQNFPEPLNGVPHFPQKVGIPHISLRSCSSNSVELAHSVSRRYSRIYQASMDGIVMSGGRAQGQIIAGEKVSGGPKKTRVSYGRAHRRSSRTRSRARTERAHVLCARC